MALVDSALVLSVGGGLLARQLKFAVFGPPDACPRPVIMPPIEPELRIPASPELCAAWAAGALVAQTLVLLTRMVFARMRGGTSLRIRKIGAARVELCSAWRGGGGECYTQANATPDAVAGLALDAVLRSTSSSTAVVVVNV